ncbi:dimeric alpha-beta barrel protein [Rutstroemia sp. NJR-2017a BBW]|nr:dimeric alpha-beta barrel protein [Rutstroemia sp. NJR-2017a BBW]
MSDASAQSKGRPLKYTITHHRRPEHTHEEFIKWIVEEHIPLAVPLFKKYGVTRYSLFRPTWEYADFDCFIEYWLPDLDCVMKLMTDPDWPAAIKNQDDWVDMSRALVSVGYETPYLLDGEIVNLPK